MTNNPRGQRRRERRAQQLQERRRERGKRRGIQRRNRRLTRVGLYLVAGLLGVGLLYGGYTIFTDWRASQPPEGVASTQNVQTGHSEDPIDYGEGLPPVGGVHSGTGAQPCSFYDTPVENELAVHSLEHGAVWITYIPDSPADEVAKLRELADESKVLVSPYPGQPSPIVATAWGNQLEFERADDPDIKQFIRAFRGTRGTAPEPTAPC